jgi:hypothetical protein
MMIKNFEEGCAHREKDFDINPYSLIDIKNEWDIVGKSRISMGFSQLCMLHNAKNRVNISH